MSIKPVLNTVATSLALAFTLSGCGGGGGGGETTAAPASPSAPATPAAPAAPATPAAPAALPAATVAALVPGASMSWATSSTKSISLTVQAPGGQAAGAAALRIFTLTRASPHDGSPLEEPVPVSLVDTLVSDAQGRASLSLLWPGHVDELLVVATLDDMRGRVVLKAGTEGTVPLQLSR